MSRKSPPAKTPAEVERRRKIGAGTSAFWASPEGRALKEKMRRQRKGRTTPAHDEAMAQRRRIYELGRAAATAEGERTAGS